MKRYYMEYPKTERLLNFLETSDVPYIYMHTKGTLKVYATDNTHSYIQREILEPEEGI